jgi:hypothetical protein
LVLYNLYMRRKVTNGGVRHRKGHQQCMQCDRVCHMLGKTWRVTAPTGLPEVMESAVAAAGISRR